MIKAADRTQSLFSNYLVALNIELTHYGILFLLTHEGSLSQVKLGQQMGIDRAPMVQLIDHLEHLGLVERTPDSHDRRVNSIQLTDHGRAVWTQATELARIAEAEILAPLSAEERQQLNQLLNQVLATRSTSND